MSFLRISRNVIEEWLMEKVFIIPFDSIGFNTIRKLEWTIKNDWIRKNTWKKAISAVSFVKLNRKVLHLSCHGKRREAESEGTAAPDRHFNRRNEGNWVFKSFVLITSTRGARWAKHRVGNYEPPSPKRAGAFLSAEGSRCEVQILGPP